MFKTFCILIMSMGMNAFSVEIPIEIKLEYASKMNEAFHWQAAGQSTIAFAVFDQGYQKAQQSGESPANLSIVLRLFSWYRKYGQYLGVMSSYAHDYDKIHGEYQVRNSFSSITPSPLPSPVLEARRREFLLGFGEIISGVLGVLMIPNPTAKRVAFTVALDGGKRFWKIYQDVKIERDFALYELKQITNSIEQLAKDSK